MRYEEFIEEIKTHRLIIYGAGHVAEKFFWALVVHGYENNIDGIITTRKEGGFFHGRRKQDIAHYEYHEGDLICIAVHNVLVEEIEDKLREKNICSYTWIYPFLYRFMLGDTRLGSNVEIDMKTIIERTTRDYYLLAVRRVALEQFYKKNDFGYDLYIRCISLYCDHKTACRRLKRYINLMEKWETEPPINKEPIIIFDDGLLFDGTHRLVLMQYYGIEKIKCDVYKHSDAPLFTEEGHLTKRVLLREGFSDNEIKKLDNANYSLKHNNN